MNGVVPLAAMPMTTSFGADLGVRHGLRAGLGSLSSAPSELRTSASSPPAMANTTRSAGQSIGRRQLGAVLHADPPGRAGAGIDDPSAALQRRHRVLDRSGDRAKRAAHGGGRRKLPLIHGRDHLGRGPGIELDVARADLLRCA